MVVAARDLTCRFRLCRRPERRRRCHSAVGTPPAISCQGAGPSLRGKFHVLERCACGHLSAASLGLANNRLSCTVRAACRRPVPMLRPASSRFLITYASLHLIDPTPWPPQQSYGDLVLSVTRTESCSISLRRCARCKLEST